MLCSHKAAFTVFAVTAGNIERHADAVTGLDTLHGAASLVHHAHVFMAENLSLFHIDSFFIHMEIGAADIGDRNFYRHVGRAFRFGVRYRIDYDVAETFIDNGFYMVSLLAHSRYFKG
jgi:hypothetical protein